jgi:hypothetical protein
MSAPSCDWKRVGPDAGVETPAGVRTVQFAWLRGTLRKASAASSQPAPAKDPAAKEAALKAASAGLNDAGLRLDRDLAPPPPNRPRDVAPERAALRGILDGGGYAREVPPTLFERIRDQFLNWLNRRLSAIGASDGSQFLVDSLVISLLAIVCGVMFWWFARKVHSQRLMLAPGVAPHPSAPSSQDWRQWLEQGRSFAEAQQWREAIHHVYWSAISLLESRGLWPADRARTPREYLSLLAARPETRGDLDTLTRSFERTWYGDQAAGRPDFDRACALLERLAR